MKCCWIFPASGNPALARESARELVVEAATQEHEAERAAALLHVVDLLVHGHAVHDRFDELGPTEMERWSRIER